MDAIRQRYPGSHTTSLLARQREARVATEKTPVKGVLQRAAINAGPVNDMAPAIVQDVLHAPGQPLDAETRSFMEPRFGNDFSNVRVHADDRAAASARSVNALAYIVGNHIAFDTGRYRPDTSGGQRLLAHELTHVVQQNGRTPGSGPLLIEQPESPFEWEAEQLTELKTIHSESATAHVLPGPAVQRRERPNNVKLDPDGDFGDWTVNDRVYETARWQRACFYNLIKLRPFEFTQPHERRDFYLWVYNYTSGLGFETRWPLAAYVVAGGAARLSYGSPFENDVQVAARQGNQIIFDDVFPKLRALIHGPVLKGTAAQAWDAQTLSDEQELVQNMYKTTASSTIDKFGNYARQKGFLATTGSWAGFSQPQRAGKYHRQLDTPPFKGNIRDVDARYAYGMQLADIFSKHPSSKSTSPRPTAGTQYTSGTEFSKLNTRMGLHRLDAELDDMNVDEDRVIELMQALSPDEQRELGFNIQRLRFIRDALNAGEMRKALNGLIYVAPDTRAFLAN